MYNYQHTSGWVRPQPGPPPLHPHTHFQYAAIPVAYGPPILYYWQGMLRQYWPFFYLPVSPSHWHSQSESQPEYGPGVHGRILPTTPILESSATVGDRSVGAGPGHVRISAINNSRIGEVWRTRRGTIDGR